MWLGVRSVWTQDTPQGEKIQEGVRLTCHEAWPVKGTVLHTFTCCAESLSRSIWDPHLQQVGPGSQQRQDAWPMVPGQLEQGQGYRALGCRAGRSSWAQLPGSQAQLSQAAHLCAHSLAGSRGMAGLNVSIAFFLATLALCEAVRKAAKALLPAGAYSVAREAAGAAQLGACCLEMRALAEVGPWAGGVGPDLLLTLLFLLFLAHGATFDGAAANPTVTLQDWLLAEASLAGAGLRVAAQALGLQAGCTLTRLFWACELSDLHMLQHLMAQHCSSALRTDPAHGTTVEAACACLFHLTLLSLRRSPQIYKVPAIALLVTVMAYTGGHLKGHRRAEGGGTKGTEG